MILNEIKQLLKLRDLGKVLIYADNQEVVEAIPGLQGRILSKKDVDDIVAQEVFQRVSE
jgi:hypothetical protein